MKQRYCYWKKIKDDFWIVADTNNKDIGWVCTWLDGRDAPTTLYISYVNEQQPLEMAKKSLGKNLTRAGWIFIKDKRLIVMS